MSAPYSALLFDVVFGVEGREDGGMLPRALSTAKVAHALLTVWCAKNPGKWGSGSPVADAVFEFVEGPDGLMYLKRKMRAWSGWREASESGSRE